MGHRTRIRPHGFEPVIWLRHAGVRLHAGIVLALALLVCVLVYVIGRHYYIRLDMTRENVNSLTEKTKEVLASFKSEPIRILAFFPANHPEKLPLEDLLKEYRYLNGNLTYQIVNPDRSPALARQHRVDAYGVIVIQVLDREARIDRVSEQDITEALARILAKESRQIYFVKGHAEASPQDVGEDGCSGFAVRLKGLVHDVSEFELGRSGIPDDADLIVVLGPHSDLSQTELERLRNYFESGGRLLIASDPVLPGEGGQLRSFLMSLGVDAGNDVVIDPASRGVGGNALMTLVVRYAKHPALRDCPIGSLFPVARSIRRASNVPPSLQMTEVAFTSEETWAETDLSALEDGKANYDEGIDFSGPISVAVLVEQQDGKGRMVVLGDSDAIKNAFFHAARNRDFLMSLTGWLLDEMPLVKIEAPDSSKKLVILTPSQEVLLFAIPVLVAPGIFLLAGLVIHWFRKRYS